MGDIYGDVPVRMCLKCTQILRRQLPNDGCPGEGPTSGTNQSAERWIRLLSNDRFWGLVKTSWQSPICSWICHTGFSPPPPLIINFILLMTIMAYNLYYHDVKNSYRYNAFKMNMYSEYAIAHEKDRITCSICAHKTVTSRFFVVTCGSGLDTNGQNSETWIKQEVENLNTICTFGLFWRWSQLGNCITEDGWTGRHYFSCLRSILEWNNNNCNRLWDYAWCKRITRYCVLHLYPTLIILLLKTGESCFFFDWGRPDLTSAKKWDKKAEVVKTFVIRRLRCYHINYLQSWW